MRTYSLTLPREDGTLTVRTYMSVDYHDHIRRMQYEFGDTKEYIQSIVSLHFSRRSTTHHQKTPEKPGSAAPAPKKPTKSTLNMG